MLKTILASAAIFVVAAPECVLAAPQTLSQEKTICYMITSAGQLIDLTRMCEIGHSGELDPIVVTNQSLEVPNERYLSSRVRATITNRSNKPVKLAVVQFQINNSGTPLATVPIFVNQTLRPGQSVPASGLFDKDDLNGVDANRLSVSFQSWQ